MGEATYLALIVVVFALGFGICVSPRLKELDLPKGRISLQEIDKAQHEVHARLEDLRSITRNVAKVLALNGALAGRLTSPERGYMMLQWNRHMIGSLMERLDIPAHEQREALDYLDMMIRIDENQDKGERVKVSEQLEDRIRAELQPGGLLPAAPRFAYTPSAQT
jgi:hypothetical protein